MNLVGLQFYVRVLHVRNTQEKRGRKKSQNNCQGEKHKCSENDLQTAALYEWILDPSPEGLRLNGLGLVPSSRALWVSFLISNMLSTTSGTSAQIKRNAPPSFFYTWYCTKITCTSLKHFATVLRIKIHHHQSYIQKTARFSVCKFWQNLRVYLWNLNSVSQLWDNVKKDGYFF